MNNIPPTQPSCNRRKRLSNTSKALLLAIITLGMTAIAHAAEINSNGVGGGQWNDPSTWRGSVVPNSLDDVTIARGDVVTFDRNDQDRISCNKLFIDPNGSLTFKTGSGNIMMVLADAIESYGSIKIDAARTQGDVIELRMIGEAQNQRTLTLMRGGSISVAGQRFLNENEATAIISAHPGKQGFTQSSGTLLIATQGNTAIDLHNTRLDAVTIQASNIDNTNAFAGQRLNIIGNYFRGKSAIVLSDCDTPVIADNTFINTSERNPDLFVISIASTPLPTVRNNTINARVARAIVGTGLTDPLIQKNRIENAEIGIVLQTGSNVMIQENTLINCKVGIHLRVRSGVVRDCVMDHCELPFVMMFSMQQFINNRIINPVADKPYFGVRTSKVILFNMQAQPEHVTANPGNRDMFMISHQPLIVKVNGKIPAGSVVVVVPVDPDMLHKEDYPPVVNSPANLQADGLTPTMITTRALMVRSWQMIEPSVTSTDAFEKLRATSMSTRPTYHVRVLGPETLGEKAERKVLASKTVTPEASWYREDLNDPAPMVEITLP